jgi:hypothetical protein
MNMSYCMYENTLEDLRQVFEDMERRYYADDSQPEVDPETGEIAEYDEDNAPLSDREAAAREKLLQICRDIAEMFGEA